MKKLLIFGMLVFAGWACTQQKKITQTQSDATSISIDSTEYQIIIIDPEFERWFLMRYSPALDRSNEYYRSLNSLGVNNWNDYFNRGKYSRVIGSYIHYNPTLDYGMDVNRKLYWYFKYIEENTSIRLLR